jgi:hypothetical protein
MIKGSRIPLVELSEREKDVSEFSRTRGDIGESEISTMSSIVLMIQLLNEGATPAVTANRKTTASDR